MSAIKLVGIFEVVAGITGLTAVVSFVLFLRHPSTVLAVLEIWLIRAYLVSAMILGVSMHFATRADAR